MNVCIYVYIMNTRQTKGKATKCDSDRGRNVLLTDATRVIYLHVVPEIGWIWHFSDSLLSFYTPNVNAEYGQCTEPK